MKVDWKECAHCGDDVHPHRWALGYRICLACGEDLAINQRRSWCVVQPYGKGNYMLVTPESAPSVLRQTNQKAVR